MQLMTNAAYHSTALHRNYYSGRLVPRSRSGSKYFGTSGSRRLDSAGSNAVIQFFGFQHSRECHVYYFRSSGEGSKASIMDFVLAAVPLHLSRRYWIYVDDHYRVLLQSMSNNQILLLGIDWKLNHVAVVLLYLAGFAGLVLVLASIYLVLPPKGNITPKHALVAAVTVGILWEVTRHVLVWYFSTMSVVGVVYGSLATTIIGLLSLEIAAILLLLGAQVIAEYERIENGDGQSGELNT